VVSVDVSGIVNKLSFTKIFLGPYVVDTACLLDGRSGQIPSVSILSQVGMVGPEKSGAMLNPLKAATSKPPTLALIALSSEKSSFVVTIEPSVKVSKPPGGEVWLSCVRRLD
jgi:hypothetical protein